MNRAQLEHSIRAAASISEESRIIIIGSQAILGSFPDAPESLLTSMKVDAFPESAPEKSDIIDGCIGELSPFHETYGYYVHGVGPETAILPKQWRLRLCEVQSPATYGCIGLCLSPADLAVSKLLASRPKDIAFVQTMVREALVSPEGILALADELSEADACRLREAISLVHQ